MRLIRVFIGLCFIFVAVATVPMWFSNTVAVFFTMGFAVIGLWVMGYSVGSTKLLERARLRYLPRKPLTSADLDRIFSDEFEKNPELSDQYKILEREVKKVADEMEQDMLIGKAPNPSFNRDALKRAR